MGETNDIQQAMERGDVELVGQLLKSDARLANKSIVWGADNKNISDPLHFVSDCVFNGLLEDSTAVSIAELLINHGALINGSENAESPLIGAASLSAVGVAHLLIERGAELDRVALFGATALHWAAYVGTLTVVKTLLDRGAPLDKKCSEFESTPLFWAVHGFSKYGPAEKTEQVEVAEMLIARGANVNTTNDEGVSAIARSRQSESNDMTLLLEKYAAT